MDLFRNLFGFTSDSSHLFLIVGPNQWPMNLALSVFVTVLALVNYLHNYGAYLLILGSVWMLKNVIFWLVNILEESDVYHTLVVSKSLKFGFVLFMVSEIMLFLGFFWAFFHSSLCPSMVLGLHWLSVGIAKAEFSGMPAFNTLLLMTSGFSVTWAHKALLVGLYKDCANALAVTMLLAFLFLVLQCYEYYELPFNMSDGIYPSVFYMLTGLHGFHVLFGTMFLMVCFFSLMSGKYLKNHHLGFVLAIYYWHFVDVIWMLLFLSLYCWSGS